MPKARRPFPVAVAFAAGVALLQPLVGPTPTPVSAQSIVRGELEGVVRATDGYPPAEVFVTATEVRSGAQVEAETDRDGTFRISFLRSGEFEIRVESMGYVPQLLRGVRVPPGQTLRLSLELVAAPPPVVTVDTVFVGGGGHARYGGEGGRRVTRGEMASFPDPRMGLGGLASLSPVLDESLGSEGLPGAMSQVLLDGIPFTPAAHPLQRGGAGDLPVLPRIGLDQMEVHRSTDVEWSGAAGSYVSAMSRSAARETAVEFHASGAPGALWYSRPVSRTDVPDANSAWGGGAGHLPLSDGRSQVFVGVEGMMARTPRLSPLSAEMADRVAGSWPGGEAIGEGELGAPWVSELQAVSALTRLDWRVAENAEVMARVGVASLRDGGARLFARPLEYGVTAPVEGNDIAGAASVLMNVHPQADLELRAGFERSVRDWGSTEGGSDPATLPPTRFVQASALLGPDSGLAGGVSRTAFQGGGTAHVRLGEHQLKGGIGVTIPSYEYEHVHRSTGEFFFSEPEGMAVGEGVFVRATGGVPRSFSILEAGVFVQHRWEPIRGIRMTSGLRFDRESLPDGDVPPNQRWAELTGIRNDDFPGALSKVSTRLRIAWDLSGDGRTVLDAGLATQYGGFDPAAMNEVASLSGSVRTVRQVGGLGAWPELPPPEPGLPTLAIFGPGLDAPQTARAVVRFSQQVGRSTVLHLSGTFRQTRNLLRRSDLNLTLGSVGNLDDGRPVYGELTQVGSLIVADPGTNRRFSEFDQVWALNPDGWSDYRAVTLAVEHQLGAALDAFASYTFSETEDNLVGARSGVPEARMRPGLGGAAEDWSEGVSDFDAPDRAAVGVRGRLAVVQGLEMTGIYRFRSGVPYTPGFRPGVDVNGDGSGFNDPAFVAEGGAGPTACLNPDVGRIATRNGCRSDGVSSLDLHLALGLLQVGSSVASLTVDIFNVTDAELGLPDNALWLVDPAGSVEQDPGSGAFVLPLVANPDFGRVTSTLRPGRLIRIGFKVRLP